MNEKTTPLKRKIKENNICEEPNTAEKQSKMSTSQTKTSITILQEICAKQVKLFGKIINVVRF